MSEQLFWNKIKQNLQADPNKKLLHSVLNSVVLESSVLKGEKYFTLNVPSIYHQKILQNFLPDIQNQIKNQGVLYKTIHIKKVLLKINQNLKKSIKTAVSPTGITKTYKKKTSAFYSNWTFSSFIQGPSNYFAFALAQSVAKQPLKNNTNPLFIYGPSGVGKTHLLHAIANSLEKENSNLKICYLPAERFFNDCINHIRKNAMAQFRQKYRENIDILLLDDVQILGKGESIQGEFFHTFETLKQNSCQIILASDQKPKNIKGLKDRIKTRFEGGVVIDIKTPDKDIKIAIIKNKSHKMQLNISEDIILFLADLPSNSIRELEGHLNKIKMFCELQNTKFSLNLAEQLFSEEFSSHSFDSSSHFNKNFNSSKQQDNSSTTLNDSKIILLQNIICKKNHIKLSELKSKSRFQSLVQARNLIMYIARTELHCSLIEIGKHFGNRNHSTILNGIKNIEIQQKKNPDLSRNIKYLKSFIHNKK